MLNVGTTYELHPDWRAVAPVPLFIYIAALLRFLASTNLISKKERSPRVSSSRAMKVLVNPSSSQKRPQHRTVSWKTPLLQQQRWSITPRFAQEGCQSPEGCCRPVSLHSADQPLCINGQEGGKGRSITKNDTDQTAGLSSGDPTRLQNLHGVQPVLFIFLFLFSSGNVGS